MKRIQIMHAFGAMYIRRIGMILCMNFLYTLHLFRYDMSQSHVDRTIEGLLNNSAHLNRAEKEVRN